MHRGKSLAQDSGEVLDEVRTVASSLELDNDGFDNVIVDGLEVDFGSVGAIRHLDTL